jgi:DNA repair protein RadC
MASGREELVGLRRRLQELGPAALAEHELLALVLGGGRGSPTARSQALAEALGCNGGLARALPEELAGHPGVGPAAAARLVAALELGRRAAAPAPPAGVPIRSSRQVAGWFRSRLQHRQREGLHALLLDGKHRPLGALCLAEGNWTSCQADPKSLLAACLRRGAPAAILIHNHPSGDPTPSREDLVLTERLVRAAGVVGIEVLDHLIVGREGTFSLADAGLM